MHAVQLQSTSFMPHVAAEERPFLDLDVDCPQMATIVAALQRAPLQVLLEHICCHRGTAATQARVWPAAQGLDATSVAMQLLGNWADRAIVYVCLDRSAGQQAFDTAPVCLKTTRSGQH